MPLDSESGVTPLDSKGLSVYLCGQLLVELAVFVDCWSLWPTCGEAGRQATVL